MRNLKENEGEGVMAFFSVSAHAHEYLLTRSPFRRPITGLVLNVSFWPELEHKMAFVYARKDDVAVASF